MVGGWNMSNETNIKRDANGRVMKGSVLNPRGRTKGSRTKLTEATLQRMAQMQEDYPMELVLYDLAMDTSQPGSVRGSAAAKYLEFLNDKNFTTTEMVIKIDDTNRESILEGLREQLSKDKE
jgi:hypothetical protein